MEEIHGRRSGLQVPPRPGHCVSPTTTAMDSPLPPRLTGQQQQLPTGIEGIPRLQYEQQGSRVSFHPSLSIRYPSSIASSQYIRQQQGFIDQGMRQHQPQGGVNARGMFGPNSQVPQDYISSLLHHQTASLKEMIQKIDDLVWLVDNKKNDVSRETKKTYMRLVKDDGVDSVKKIERLLHRREEIRRLKIEVSGLVTEIDSFGDHYLGHEDLKPVPRRSSSTVCSGRTSVSPPPVPPRPSYNKLQSQVSHNSQFNELSVRVPLPKGVPRSGRRPPDTLAYNSYSRTTSVSSNSNNNSPTTPSGIVSGDVVASSHEKPHWNCLQCSFANHPDLSICEICEAKKEAFVPASSSNLSSNSYLTESQSSHGNQGAVGGF